jgi:prolyl oligopeptidase PreP (S9A serine peptidase family)
MKLILEFDEVCNKIAKHVGYEGYIENYQIDTSHAKSFWQLCNEETVYWADTEEDILEDTDDVYSSDVKGVYRGEELTLILVESDFGNGDYWLVLDSKNEIK